MIYPPELLDTLQSAAVSVREGTGSSVKRANWLGHDGLLVPSARRIGGTNLVIYQQDPPTGVFEVTSQEILAEDER